ncbi:hypothetical protein GCM10027071_04840 [Microbacterium marinum]
MRDGGDGVAEVEQEAGAAAAEVDDIVGFEHGISSIEKLFRRQEAPSSPSRSARAGMSAEDSCQDETNRVPTVGVS